VIENSISPIDSAVTQRTLAGVVIFRLIFLVAREAIFRASQRMIEMDVAPGHRSVTGCTVAGEMIGRCNLAVAGLANHRSAGILPFDMAIKALYFRMFPDQWIKLM
jgi:hypothetical protein